MPGPPAAGSVPAPAPSGGPVWRVTPAVGGAVAMAVGAVLPWFRFEGAPSESGFGIPLKFLYDFKTSGDTATGVGVLVLAAAVVTAVGLLWPGREVLRKAGAGVGIGIALLYVVQLQRLASFANDAGNDISVTSMIGLGVVVSIGGAVAALLAPHGRTP